MNCINPSTIKITTGMQPGSLIKRAALVPCGKCKNCRINQGRVWTNRILLEQMMHSNSTFVTLTYDEKHLPDPPHVSKQELQNYIKRLRWNLDPKKFRYYGVGEYGKLWRPHYHVILFGIDGSLHERQIRRSWKDEKGKYKCKPERLDIGYVNPASARYITGYITKKIEKETKVHPIDYGKPDEFMLSSKGGGGIGIKAVQHLCEVLGKCDYVQGRTKELRIGGKKYPLGRYLEEKLNGVKVWEQRLVDFRAMQESLYENTRKREIGEGKYNTRRRKL